jgi:hypothetical protein
MRGERLLTLEMMQRPRPPSKRLRAGGSPPVPPNISFWHGQKSYPKKQLLLELEVHFRSARAVAAYDYGDGLRCS